MPVHFCSKALIVPHLHLVIAGVGAAGLVPRWFDALNSWKDGDAADAARASTVMLHQIWRWKVACREIEESDTATLFLIGRVGIDRGESTICGFSFDSGQAFECQPMGAPAIHMIPALASPPGPAEGLVGVVEAQRQAAHLMGRGNVIGGRVQLIEMTHQSISTRSIHAFHDFPSVAAKVGSRIDAVWNQPYSPRRVGWLARKLLRWGRPRG